MNVMQAAYHLVREAPGGAVALGQAIGKNPATLSHEVHPGYPHHKFGLEDAVVVSVFAKDRRILNAFAAELSCMVIPLPVMPPGAESAASRTAALAREFGELMAEVSVDLADGSVSDNERARIEREAGQLVSALQELLAEVRGMNERGQGGQGGAA